MKRILNRIKSAFCVQNLKFIRQSKFFNNQQKSLTKAVKIVPKKFTACDPKDKEFLLMRYGYLHLSPEPILSRNINLRKDNWTMKTQIRIEKDRRNTEMLKCTNSESGNKKECKRK